MSPWMIQLVLFGCGMEGQAPPTPEAAPKVRQLGKDSPNVVFISLDTLRADRVGAYGYDKAKTDTLDALAASGARYVRTYAPVPLTIPSHAAMFTGRYPASMGIRQNGDGTVPESALTLAEVLAQEGWNTAASVAAYVTTETWGFSQGFSSYFDDIPADGHNFWHGWRPGREVVDDALAWKAEQDGDSPVFLWVHLYDAHFPYMPPPAYLEASEGRPYDAEIALVDDLVGEVVDAFEGEPTLFVVVGDHGEGLNDHDELTHGLFVHEVDQRVPFIMSGPGVVSEVVEAPISLVDVTPAILDALQLEVPAGMDGAVPGGEERPIYMESWQLSRRFGIAPHLAVVDGPMKLIDLPRPELYDVVQDPMETTNLADARPDEVERLRKLRLGFGFEVPGVESGLPSDVAEQLAALGYIEGGFGADGTVPTIDPKDRIDLIKLSQVAERERLLGRPAEERVALADLVQQFPEILEFRVRYVAALYAAGLRDEAWAETKLGLETAPDNISLRLSHATQLANRGRHAEAATVFGKLAVDKPDLPRIRTMTVAALMQAGETDAALEIANGFLMEHPEDLSLSGMMGVWYLEHKNIPAAVPLLEKGIEADDPEYSVRFYAAARARQEGSLVEAAELLASELDAHPLHERARRAAIQMAHDTGDWPLVASHTAFLLERDDSDPYLHYMLILSTFNQGDVAGARAAVDIALVDHSEHPWVLLMEANVLAKEGNMELGKTRFEAAQRALMQRREELEGVLKSQQAALPGELEAAQPEVVSP